MPETSEAEESGRTAPGPPAPSPSAFPAPGGAAVNGGGLRELTSLQVLRTLDTGPRGLTDGDAAERLARFGENTLPARRAVSWPGRFLRSLRDPFTAVLLCLGLVSAAVAAWGTACVITVLVVVSCVLRSAGEHRADRSMAGLRDLVATTATVLRRADGKAAPVAREIPVDELVPGDVVRLGPGDLVPADVRLLRANNLSVNQAALTGESAPVVKHPVDAPNRPGGRPTGGAPTDNALTGHGHEPTHDGSTRNGPTGNGHGPAGNGNGPTGHVPTGGGATGGEAPESGPFDAPQLCFQGSSVMAGSGTAVVVATGVHTRFAAAHDSVHPRGPSAFDRSVHGISWILIRFMLLTPPLVLMANAALRGRGLETLPFAVAVAVGLTPEMLPVIVTTCLARGASLLARVHGVIVRRLPALHDLGAVDVLCLDKTGTLTQDRPVVVRALDADGRDDPEVLHWAAVNAWWTLQLADLPVPDALDEAILDADDALGEAILVAHDASDACGTADAADTADTADTADGDDGDDASGHDVPGRDRADVVGHGRGAAVPFDYDGIAAVPFDPARRLSTAVVRTPGRLGVHTLVVKGAVENVLERCALDDAERQRLLALAADRADDGLRLLAVATAERPARQRAYTPADERGLTFTGFVALREELVPSAAGALRVLADRGVTVKVLTGDHPGTVARACRDLGLDPGEVCTVDGIDRLTDRELAELADRTTVFARCTPEHKARIVTTLRAAGHTTGFLGDGVNDLPALHAADVGICPRDAVDVARESAGVVLAGHGKDLTAIDHAIAEGRRSSVTIATYLRITLSSNLGNVIAMLAAGLLLPFLPMLPAQALVQNLCFDAAQLTFSYDRVAPAALRRPTMLRPRDFLRFITAFGALNAVADLATFAVLALALRGPGGTDDEALFHSGWFTENLLTQALVMVLLRTGRRTAEAPGASGARGVFGIRGISPVGRAAAALAVTGLLLPLSPLGPPLGMTALPSVYYLLLVVVLGLYAVALAVARRRHENRGARA
ncbi:HAD-IC family P-type ATPase [Streptomyces sp. NPDC002476]|uniref:HAD-IC family P-type ATPase n=1 Tax=Streptomyces sp. NPDC002476 TaxID=3364648 RepID=UPI0036749E4E